MVHTAWINIGTPSSPGPGFIPFLSGIVMAGASLSILASFASYALEKKFSKTPGKFGTGMIEGVAGPETSNNAATSGAFIPLVIGKLPYRLWGTPFLFSLCREQLEERSTR
jgi:TctA family transporter